MGKNNKTDKNLAWDEFKSYVLMKDSRQFEAFSKYFSLQSENVQEVEFYKGEELEL